MLTINEVFTFLPTLPVWESLTSRVNVNYYKSVQHLIPTCENREHPEIFKMNQ